jgi:hypothetical protein
MKANFTYLLILCSVLFNWPEKESTTDRLKGNQRRQNKVEAKLEKDISR